MQELRCTRLVVTGHSLGGGLAVLVAVDKDFASYELAQAYAFAPPRVGNLALAKAAAERVKPSPATQAILIIWKAGEIWLGTVFQATSSTIIVSTYIFLR